MAVQYPILLPKKSCNKTFLLAILHIFPITKLPMPEILATVT